VAEQTDEAKSVRDDDEGRLDRAERWEVLPILMLAGVIGYLAASRLALRAGALSALASALRAIPPAGFWIPVAVITGPLAVVAIVFAIRRGDARPVRVFYVLSALVLFAEVFVLPSLHYSPMLTADFTVESAMRVAAMRLSSNAKGNRLPGDDATAKEAIEGLPPPPYRAAGNRLPGWRIAVRHGCTGPATEVRGLPVGTLVYCVAPDLRRGWLTEVGTGGREVGPPAMGRDAAGGLVVVEVRPMSVTDTLSKRLRAAFERLEDGGSAPGG